MSDTPRTDTESFYPHDSKWKVCDAEFARTLERELNAANQRINRLEEAGDAMVDDSEFIGNHDKILAWRKAKEAKP